MTAIMLALFKTDDALETCATRKGGVRAGQRAPAAPLDLLSPVCT
jgi:hypothetical protein